MKVIVTESQLRNILKKHKKKKEFDEAASLTSPSTTNQSTPSTPSSTTSSASSSTSSTTSDDDAGTSPGAADYPPYPEVGHWESGVTRGPANQIGVTKWSDTVGSSLTRGKSNPLK